MTKERLQDKCRGSFIGGAIGDALGYEVKFTSISAIRTQFGESGITDYTLHNGVAKFSADTQMSLFTAQGILTATLAGMSPDKNILPYIEEAYIYWYDTQIPPPIPRTNSWLSNHIDLWNRRAPEITCMQAMQAIWDDDEVHNNSKGCGGVARVAPIGIFSAAHPHVLDLEHAGYLAGHSAEITHKHPLSTFSSMALAMIVAECISQDNIDRDKFKFIVINRVFKLLTLWFKGDKHLEELQILIQKAIDFSDTNENDLPWILCEDWVAEETLAMAIFSVLRHIEDFEKCICCAVNHTGASDSAGTVAGNIIGAILGYSAIPNKCLTNLELHDLLLSVADDLGGFSSAKQLKERYDYHLP